jgi:hypothetical protein
VEAVLDALAECPVSAGAPEGGPMSAATERLAAALADVIAEAVGAIAPKPEGTLPPADLNVSQLAQRFDRTASCVRGSRRGSSLAPTS